jgi:hypothetical protein
MEICYVDADHDTYGTAAQTTTTDVLCDEDMGHAVRMGDCCDSDERARPSQTSFFPTADACGSYDYDCNTSSELEGPSLNTCPDDCSGPCGGPSFRQGWVGAVPACGEVASWTDTCTSFGCPISCVGTGDMRTQRCR